MTPTDPPVTALLAAWKGGEAGSLDRVIERLYPELRQIAHLQLGRRRPGDSMESAALANEAYLKLVRAGGISCENRLHFLALCAQVMRRILVDHARQRQAAKRGGQALNVSVEDVQVPAPGGGIELLALDEALESLARLDARKARVVELRYFGGLTLEESAELLGISIETAKRDWRMSKAWLLAQLTAERVPDEPRP